MGPDTVTSMTATGVKVVNLPKLQEDGSNWVTYKARVMNNLTSRGLLRHVEGTAQKPVQLTEKAGEYFKPGSTTALTDKELEKHDDSVDLYGQKQALVRDIVYETISKSTFLEVKDEPTAAKMWKKLVAMHENKGTMIYTDTLAKLSSMRYVDGKSMRAHISSMKELKERLAEMGMPINDDQFSAYI